jgi:hypothetical protein
MEKDQDLNRGIRLKTYYLKRLLILGIMLTCFGLYQLQDNFVIKSRLTALKGTLRAADTYITTITYRNHSSQKSELIFYLKEYNKKFYMFHNIGDDLTDQNYDDILSQLKSSDSISVWIRPHDMESYQPKFFQITNKEKIILDIKDVTTEMGYLTLFSLLLGGAVLLFYFYRRYPDKWDKIIN